VSTSLLLPTPTFPLPLPIQFTPIGLDSPISDPLPKAERALTGLLTFVSLVDADSQELGISEMQMSQNPATVAGNL
jgi:hypothetical protein